MKKTLLLCSLCFAFLSASQLSFALTPPLSAYKAPTNNQALVDDWIRYNSIMIKDEHEIALIAEPLAGLAQEDYHQYNVKLAEKTLKNLASIQPVTAEMQQLIEMIKYSLTEDLKLSALGSEVSEEDYENSAILEEQTHVLAQQIAQEVFLQLKQHSHQAPEFIQQWIDYQLLNLQYKYDYSTNWADYLVELSKLKSSDPEIYQLFKLRKQYLTGFIAAENQYQQRGNELDSPYDLDDDPNSLNLLESIEKIEMKLDEKFIQYYSHSKQ
ncbi:hypothetical protein EC844_11031 [Acinetobacter calcoaceticus]|uniref:Uncharacterized protein n=1 Tax=Acinetobacter calcoaceticus TaxID=471 RepID=A0A4R1XWQ9_ACICA|nr:hypothetical protein EC844_11031 [Acinetobacter calcoaceticus]